MPSPSATDSPPAVDTTNPYCWYYTAPLMVDSPPINWSDVTADMTGRFLEYRNNYLHTKKWSFQLPHSSAQFGDLTERVVQKVLQLRFTISAAHRSPAASWPSYAHRVWSEKDPDIISGSQPLWHTTSGSRKNGGLSQSMKKAMPVYANSAASLQFKNAAVELWHCSYSFDAWMQ